MWCLPVMAIPRPDCGVTPDPKEAVILGHSHLRPLSHRVLKTPEQAWMVGLHGRKESNRNSSQPMTTSGRPRKRLLPRTMETPLDRSGRTISKAQTLWKGGLRGWGWGQRLYLKRQGKSGLPQIKAGSPVFDSQTNPAGECSRNWRPLALGPRESSEREGALAALFLHNSLAA